MVLRSGIDPLFMVFKNFIAAECLIIIYLSFCKIAV